MHKDIITGVIGGNSTMHVHEDIADEVECCNCGITYKTSEPCL